MGDKFIGSEGLGDILANKVFDDLQKSLTATTAGEELRMQMEFNWVREEPEALDEPVPLTVRVDYSGIRGVEDTVGIDWDEVCLQDPEVIPPPDDDAPMSLWAAHLYQTLPGTWGDVADALGSTRDSVFRCARQHCRDNGVAWPLEKKIIRRKVRVRAEEE